ncbi:sulfate transporter, partial [Trifolium medium]|nr:sulfate transporter [Trifolium medium]
REIEQQRRDGYQQLRVRAYSWDGYRFNERSGGHDGRDRPSSRAVQSSELQKWHDSNQNSGIVTTGGHATMSGSVCGILENVSVANKRNIHGYRYGFVSFSKVRDVTKLLKAINNVSFGNLRIWAKVARFDRAYDQREERGLKAVGSAKPVRAKEVEGDGFRVGTVDISVREKRGQPGVKEREMVVKQLPGVVKEKLVRSYSSTQEDMSWAQSGVVASVINGEAIPLVQQRIEDAGFSDLCIVPLGADKVFIRCLSAEDAMVVINGAKKNFNHFFSLVSRWEKKIVPFQRGAWLRLYGIPLHAWNENFFRLCVMECGRFLRTDASTLDRERFDYARVLVATSSMTILNASEVLLVDGVKVEVKIIEEWGFNVGEDACLFEREEVVQRPDSKHLEEQNDLDNRHHVDVLVEKLTDELDKAKEHDTFIEKQMANHADTTKNLLTNGNDREVVILEPVSDFVPHDREGVIIAQDTDGLVEDLSDDDDMDASLVVKSNAAYADTSGISGGFRVMDPSNSCNETEAVIPPDDVMTTGSLQVTPTVSLKGCRERSIVSKDHIPSRRRRNVSCPPARECPVLSGPWSMEWLC